MLDLETFVWTALPTPVSPGPVLVGAKAVTISPNEVRFRERPWRIYRSDHRPG